MASLNGQDFYGQSACSSTPQPPPTATFFNFNVESLQGDKGKGSPNESNHLNGTLCKATDLTTIDYNNNHINDKQTSNADETLVHSEDDEDEEDDDEDGQMIGNATNLLMTDAHVDAEGEEDEEDEDPDPLETHTIYMSTNCVVRSFIKTDTATAINDHFQRSFSLFFNVCNNDGKPMKS